MDGGMLVADYWLGPVAGFAEDIFLLIEFGCR